MLTLKTFACIQTQRHTFFPQLCALKHLCICVHVCVRVCVCAYVCECQCAQAIGRSCQARRQFIKMYVLWGICVRASACVCYYSVHITVYIIDEYDNDTSWHCAHTGICVHTQMQGYVRLRIYVSVCVHLCIRCSGLRQTTPQQHRMPHHLGSDSLTIDSTLFCWQRDGETDRQVDRHADSIWCKTGDLWTHVVVRKTLPPELSLSFALSLSLAFPWHMLCVVGRAPHADLMPSALPGLRATCATLSHSSSTAPRTHTRTHRYTLAHRNTSSQFAPVSVGESFRQGITDIILSSQ